LETAVVAYNEIAKEKGFKQVNPENREMLRGLSPQKIMSELGISIFELPGVALKLRKELKQSVSKWKPHEGVRELVTELKHLGYRLFILSSNSEENVREFLRMNNLDVFGDVVSATSAFGKARLLKQIMRASNLVPAETIYVGDEIRDIEGAKKAGIEVISVPWGLNTAEALAKYSPTLVAHAPNDILTYLTTQG
jgi:HAD superfamily hydrolase (TIGR01549 family)